jgi:hypothetical protein
MDHQRRVAAMPSLSASAVVRSSPKFERPVWRYVTPYGLCVLLSHVVRASPPLSRNQFPRQSFSGDILSGRVNSLIPDEAFGGTVWLAITFDSGY